MIAKKIGSVGYGPFVKKLDWYCGAVCVTPTGRIIACSGANIYKSDDNGKTWAACQNLPTASYGSGFAGAAVVTPTGRIIIGCSGYYSGLLYSDDNGETWSNIIESGTQKLYITPTGTILGLAGPYGQGLKYSNDSGETWANLISSMDVNAICVTANGRMIIGNNQGVNYSDDNGETITHVFIQSGEGDIDDVDSIVELDNELFMSCSYGLYHSTDNGESWSRINIVSSVGGNARKLCVSSAGRLAVIMRNIDPSGIYYSDDKGVTWSYSQESDEYGYATAYSHGSYISGLYTTSNGKIFAAADGSSPALLCSDLVTEIQESYTSKPLTGAQAKVLVQQCKAYVQELKNSL